MPENTPGGVYVSRVIPALDSQSFTKIIEHVLIAYNFPEPLI
jgi:hypothetical protein